MRSEIFITAGMSCSTSSTVTPRSRTPRTISTVRIVSSWFMPANGSSSSSTVGSVARPIAMPSARRWPCGRLRGDLVGVGGARPRKREDLVGGAAEGRLVGARRAGAEEEAEQAGPRAQVMGDDDVVAHAHAPEDRRLLEGADHALRATRCGARPEIRSPLKRTCRTGRGGGDQLEQRRLAGAVRADDRQDLALLHIEGDVVDGGEPDLAPRARPRARDDRPRYRLDPWTTDAVAFGSRGPRPAPLWSSCRPGRTRRGRA